MPFEIDVGKSTWDESKLALIMMISNLQDDVRELQVENRKREAWQTAMGVKFATIGIGLGLLVQFLPEIVKWLKK